MKKIPCLATEDQEREFWATHDYTEYVDWSKARPAVFPSLRPSLRTISLRLPESMLEDLRVLANQRDVPYQSLLKTFLSDRIRQETSARKSPARATPRLRRPSPRVRTQRTGVPG